MNDEKKPLNFQFRRRFQKIAGRFLELGLSHLAQSLPDIQPNLKATGAVIVTESGTGTLANASVPYAVIEMVGKFKGNV